MDSISQRNKKPWFKQFWPWFLISLPGSVVIASMVTISIAIDSAPTITDRDIGKFARDTGKTTAIAPEPDLPKQ